jgi:pheromone shutdown-related protein TraB
VTTEPLVDLNLGQRTLRMLGTAHVSRASADAVAAEIASGRYTDIAIELCQNRFRGMVEPDAIERMDLFEVIRDGKVPVVTAMLALGAFQQRIAEQFGIEPGAEMRAAIDGALARGLNLHLIDRDVGITLRRIYRNVPWYRRMYLFSGLFASILVDDKVPDSEVEALKQGDLLESTFAQFAASAPPIYTPLIEERDRYMASRLHAVVENSNGAVLAVVGAGHLAGLRQHLEQPAGDRAATVRELEYVPPAATWTKYLPWLLLVFLCGGFALGFARSPDLGWSLVVEWIAITGGLAALGAVLAGAHLVTILCAFLGAPFTTLHPAIGIGMLTAPVEAWLRKPTVAAFKRLRHDTTSLAGWRSNPVARVFLVFFLSSLGAASGTYIGGFRIFQQLFT